MRKAVILGTALLLSAALVLAQDTATSSSASDTSTASSNTVQGCLSGSAGNWTLTDATGATYQIEGDESQLAGNANKQVEVTGTMGAKASASATNNPDTSAPATGNAGEASGSASSSAGTGGATGTATGSNPTASAGKTLTVTSVRKVADSCSNQQTAPQQ